MVIYIMLPMVLASIIDPLIIRAVALEPTAEVLAKYPSYAGSYLYPYELFLAAAVSAVFILIPAYFVRRDAGRIRREKLAALEKMTPSTERQTAARKKRKTLYPLVILLVARLFCLMVAAMPIVLIYGMIVEGFKVWYFVMTCVMTLLFAYSIYWLWPLCFGELTLTEGYVKWHALFIRSVKIPYSELRYVEIRHFDEGNVVPDLYGTGQMYLLLSSKSLPKKRIDKIRSGDGLIKYQFLMRDAAVFSEYLPERYKPMFQSRAEAYTRAKEKRARDWQKWKAKRKKAREKRRKKRQAEK